MKTFLKIIYFLFCSLFIYAMYTQSLYKQANTYYKDNVYQNLSNAEKAIEYLAPIHAEKYDRKAIYRAVSTLESKSFEINFYAYLSKKNDPGILVVLNHFNIANENENPLYIKVKFYIGQHPSSDYIVTYDRKHNSQDTKHYINIPFNYDQSSDYSYFVIRDSGEQIKLSAIEKFEFSYGYDGKNFTPFLLLNNQSTNAYGYSEDIFTLDNDLLTSNHFSGAASRFNLLLNPETSTITQTNQTYYNDYNYIVYWTMILTIFGVFLVTFIIFYRKLIVYWYQKIKNRNKPELK